LTFQLDFTRVLKAGYEQFQYVAIALEFIKDDLASNREDYDRKEGLNFTNILRAPFAPIFFHQKLQSLNATREKLRKTLLYKKFEHIMLMK